MGPTIRLPPLPCAVRPFLDEALGSWIGRLAGQYRITVEQLDAAYEIGLAGHRRLGWLAPGPLTPSSEEALAFITRLDGRFLRPLEMPTAWSESARALYCPRCVFLNPLDVTQPYWKLEWLSPAATRCPFHAQALRRVSSAAVLAAGNMPRLIRAVGALEQRLRRMAASGWH